jgi:hypothetical protein
MCSGQSSDLPFFAVPLGAAFLYYQIILALSTLFLPFFYFRFTGLTCVFSTPFFNDPALAFQRGVSFNHSFLALSIPFFCLFYS